MAKRDRVSHIKSNRKTRNKNPKLSPFQREVKRGQLANQAPTLKSFERESQVPHSQRSVFNYLQQRRERKEQQRSQKQQEKDAEAEERAAAEAAAVAAAAEAVANAEKPKKKMKRARSSEASDEAQGSEPVKKKKKRDDAKPKTAEVGAENVKKKTQKRKKKQEVEEAVEVESDAKEERKRKKKVASRPQVQSLNASFTSELALAPRYAYRADTSSSSRATTAATEEEASRPLTVEEIIARKKEKKHKRKSELRRQQTMEKFSKMEEELTDLMQSSGKVKGKGARGNVVRKEEIAFEKQLRQMERQNELENNKRHKMQERERLRTQRQSTAAAAAASASAAEAGAAAAERKSISFSETVQVRDAQQTAASLLDSPHHVMRYPNDRANTQQQQQQKKKPTDFYDLVDVVRFGERVEAPPVFDVVPNKKAAISRLAATLEGQQHKSSHSAQNNRARLLSGGGNRASEQKRLERMGLIPRNQSIATSAQQGGGGGHSQPHASHDKSDTKQKEMELLRAKVMATYQKNKRKEVQTKNGVNMRHEFPQFA